MFNTETNKSAVECMLKLREELWDRYPEKQGLMVNSPEGFCQAVREIIDEMERAND